MPPGSPSSEGFRESLKRRARGVKKWLGPDDQAPVPRTSSPQPQLRHGTPPPRFITTRETPQQSSAQTQGSTLLPYQVTSAGRSASTANLEAADGDQPANVGSRLTQAAKNAGADTWTGLKVALQLLERSSDAFPPLKSAVAGFLDVVEVFEASNLVSCVITWYLFCSGSRQPPRTEATTQGSPRIFKPWSRTLQNTRESRRRLGC